MSAAAFQTISAQLAQQGYRLRVANACSVNGQDLYAALWQQPSGPAWVAHHGMTADAYQIFFNDLVGQGYRLATVAGYAGDQPVDVVLHFPMQSQLQSEWCWAATSVSTAHFYDPNSHWTQCEMVNAQKKLTTCCADGGSNACNKPGYVGDALNTCNHLAGSAGGATAYPAIISQMANRNPIAIRIGWSGGGGHAIAVTGVQDDDMVVVDDPIYGHSVITYDTLCHSYQGSGSWTELVHDQGLNDARRSGPIPRSPRYAPHHPRGASGRDRACDRRHGEACEPARTDQRRTNDRRRRYPVRGSRQRCQAQPVLEVLRARTRRCGCRARA